MSHQDDDAGLPMPPRRRRSFLATRQSERPAAPMPGPAPAPAPVIPAPPEEDDLPVLTEVVPGEEAEAAAAPAAPPTPPADAAAEFEACVEELAAQMAQAIERQMACELPMLIEATLLNAAEALREGFTSTTEVALRDFLAQRKQMQLPLDGPGPK